MEGAGGDGGRRAPGTGRSSVQAGPRVCGLSVLYLIAFVRTAASIGGTCSRSIQHNTVNPTATHKSAASEHAPEPTAVSPAHRLSLAHAARLPRLSQRGVGKLETAASPLRVAMVCTAAQLGLLRNTQRGGRSTCTERYKRAEM